jgi:hypothetical protein
MKSKYMIIAAVVALVFMVGVACEKEEESNAKSQADWCTDGWTALASGHLTDAEYLFGNAIKVDPYYAEARGGLGWTYIRQHDPVSAENVFEDAVLIAQQPGTPLKAKQIVYLGACQAYNAGENLAYSAENGRYMANNLKDEGFFLPKQKLVNTYDLYVLLCLDYFGLGDEDNTVWAINKARAYCPIGGYPATYTFNGWENAATEIGRLAAQDPDPK